MVPVKCLAILHGNATGRSSHAPFLGLLMNDAEICSLSHTTCNLNSVELEKMEYRSCFMVSSTEMSHLSMMVAMIDSLVC